MVAVLAYTSGMLLATAALAAWIFVWFLVAMLVLRRHDLGVGRKGIVAILVLPVLGIFVYFIWDASRPRSA